MQKQQLKSVYLLLQDHFDISHMDVIGVYDNEDTPNKICEFKNLEIEEKNKTVGVWNRDTTRFRVKKMEVFS